MTNNKISEALRTGRNIEIVAGDYAAKLDRLVEAARDSRDLWGDRDEYDEKIAKRFDAALADIELPKEIETTP